MIRIKLSALLGDRRITQSKLAEDLNVSRSAINKLYNEHLENLDMRILDKICSYLKVQPGDLLKWEPDPDEEEHAVPADTTKAKLK